MTKKTLVLDFDGVLHTYTSGWHGEGVVADGPVSGAVDFLLRAMDRFTVSVYSQRSSSTLGVDAMRNVLFMWVDDERGRHEALRVITDVEFPTRKPLAWVTLDDRVLTFEGRWPSLDSLEGFQAWNKRPPPSSVGRDLEVLRKTTCAPAEAVTAREVDDFALDEETGRVSFVVPHDRGPILWLPVGGYFLASRFGQEDRLARVASRTDLDSGGVAVLAAVPSREQLSEA